MHIYRETFLTILLSQYVHAIEMTPNSECSFLCDDSAKGDPGSRTSSHTTSDDLVCEDDEFSPTVVGRKFKECLICELNSTAATNLRMKPIGIFITNANSQCSDVCSGSGNSARAALVDHLLKNKNGLQYCQIGDGAFSKIADDCIKCLNEVPKAKTLTNFVNALRVPVINNRQLVRFSS
ncbi:hypothetical protein MMC07_009156 [Pseudocyphellaria aurata]|nr:hypothetical protein [Pseudocyphellaria aurata]